MKDQISRKGSFFNSSYNPTVFPVRTNRRNFHRHIRYFQPTNPPSSITVIDRKQYLNAENSIDTFVRKSDIDHLNVLRNYCKYNTIIRRGVMSGVLSQSATAGQCCGREPESKSSIRARLRQL